MKTRLNLTGKIQAIFSFLLISATCFSQNETIVYIGTNGKLTTLKEAMYLHKIKATSKKDYKVQTLQLNDNTWDKLYTEHYKKLNDSTWQINGSGKNISPKSIRTFSKLENNKWRFNDKLDGQIVRKGFAVSVIPLLLDGQVTEYYVGGKTRSVSIYRNNELVSNENWNEDGQKYIDNIFYSVDVYPTYSLGNKALHEHVMECYKKSGLDISSVSGKLTVGFVVMPDGTINGIKLLKGMGNEINKVTLEAFRSLQGKWTPAKLKNETVRYLQVFPINFITNEIHVEFAELRGGILHYQTY